MAPWTRSTCVVRVPARCDHFSSLRDPAERARLRAVHWNAAGQQVGLGGSRRSANSVTHARRRSGSPASLSCVSAVCETASPLLLPFPHTPSARMTHVKCAGDTRRRGAERSRTGRHAAPRSPLCTCTGPCDDHTAVDRLPRPPPPPQRCAPPRRLLQLAGTMSSTYAPDGTCTRLSVLRIAGYGTAVLPEVASPIWARGYYFVSLFRLFPSCSFGAGHGPRRPVLLAIYILASLSSPSLCAPLCRLGPLGRSTFWVLLFCCQCCHRVFARAFFVSTLGGAAGESASSLLRDASPLASPGENGADATDGTRDATTL